MQLKQSGGSGGDDLSGASEQAPDNFPFLRQIDGGTSHLGEGFFERPGDEGAVPGRVDPEGLNPVGIGLVELCVRNELVEVDSGGADLDPLQFGIRPPCPVSISVAVDVDYDSNLTRLRPAGRGPNGGITPRARRS